MTEAEVRELQALAEGLMFLQDTGWESGGGSSDGSRHFLLAPDDEFVAIVHAHPRHPDDAPARARYIAACSPERIRELCRFALRLPSPCTKCGGSTQIAAVEMSAGVYCPTCIVGMDIEPGTVARFAVVFVDPAAKAPLP